VVEARPGTLDPSAWPDDPFTYVDVAAIDNKRKAITGARTLKGAQAPSRARRLIRAGDVLVSTVRPQLNAVALVPAPLDGEVASTGICVLRATPRVLPEYLYFFVRSRLFVDALCRLSSGALYPAVHDAQVLAQKLPLPDLATQRRLVDMLTSAQGAARLRRELREKALRLDAAVFLEVFGDPVANPQGLPEVALGELLAAGPQNGLYKPQSAYGSGTPIVRIDAFHDGQFRDLAQLRRLRLDADELRRYALAPGDILLNRVNSPEHVGKSAYVPALAESTVFESNMMRLVADPARTHARYLFAALQTHRTRQHFRTHAKRAINQASLNQQDLKSVPVLLPPLAKQLTFARYADASAAVVAKQLKLQKLAEDTLESMLARVFDPSPSEALSDVHHI
jgi:type I restriction enzyme S subunit